MSRKYRQQGYQDKDRGSSRQSTPGRAEREGPRGRGLGKPTATRFRCARCGTDVRESEVAPDAVCTECGSDLHSCLNCSFFDTGATFECRKPIPERIASKSRANECEHFAVKSVQEFASDSSGAAPSDANSAFDDLFDF